MASQAGLPMQNLDLVQFHPAGTSRSWIFYIAACGVETLGGALGPTQAALSGDSNGLIHIVHACKWIAGEFNCSCVALQVKASGSSS